jgi:hypothetical protein
MKNGNALRVPSRSRSRARLAMVWNLGVLRLIFVDRFPDVRREPARVMNKNHDRRTRITTPCIPGHAVARQFLESVRYDGPNCGRRLADFVGQSRADIEELNGVKKERDTRKDKDNISECQFKKTRP